jgi:hypothetical protein
MMHEKDTKDDGVVLNDYLIEDTDLNLAYRLFNFIPTSISINEKVKTIKKVDLTETNIKYAFVNKVVHIVADCGLFQ